MAAENNTNNTSPPTQQLFPPPQPPDTHPPPQQGYYYATPHQLYPYMSLFYSNTINPHSSVKSEQDQIWFERNNNNNSSIPLNENDNTNNANNSSDSDSDSDFDTSGYWNLPRITYGPLASKSNLCQPKTPRIGEQYQAEIPQISEKKENENIDIKNVFKDECVWECSHVNEKELDQYCKIVQFILGTSRTSVYTDCHYDEEAALYLLKLHNYNINDCIHTLTLNKPNKNNLNFQWLFDDKNDKKEKEYISDNDNEHLYEYSNRTVGLPMSQNNLNINENDNNNDYDDYDDEDYCFACGDGGNLLICDKNNCMKVWHIHCAGLTKMPPIEDEWYCPSHACSICKNESVSKYQCSYCGNAYCDNNTCIPNECIKYKYYHIEFLCQTCLSTMNDISDIENNNNNNNNNNKIDYIYTFAKDRFMSRLFELHKRKINHLNKINGNNRDINNNNNNIIPIKCKLLGREEIQWFNLYCAVISNGGLSEIKELIKWDIIREKCNLDENFKNENTWKLLRDSYIEYLYCYEKQYYTQTNHILPKDIQNIVDEKGVLDGLFPVDNDDNDNNDIDNGNSNNGNNGNGNGNGNKTPENVDDMVLDVD